MSVAGATDSRGPGRISQLTASRELFARRRSKRNKTNCSKANIPIAKPADPWGGGGRRGGGELAHSREQERGLPENQLPDGRREKGLLGLGAEGLAPLGRRSRARGPRSSERLRPQALCRV
ncbi:hypothetical protein HJG60_011630 [Phyllostomus discolor]|uniref:Uncharacterized protein n=1 Tax=Phyllostomus discolor TaxID=89673 RepID=A0A834E1B2_9CHIR|nr:hypothetical protein HJG60_011630 [Phyllostomus discolor]